MNSDEDMGLNDLFSLHLISCIRSHLLRVDRIPDEIEVPSCELTEHRQYTHPANEEATNAIAAPTPSNPARGIPSSFCGTSRRLRPTQMQNEMKHLILLCDKQSNK